MLDAFCYSAGFSVASLAGGAAAIIALDSSNDALERAGHDGARILHRVAAAPDHPVALAFPEAH